MSREVQKGNPSPGERKPGNRGSEAAPGWERYTRQLNMRDWDSRAQKKLECSHVTVAGAGGLGSPVLLYLAAAGIGEIRIIDNDTVQLSNLNRQILYKEGDIGSYKTRSASGSLSELNSDIHIESSTGTITEETIEEIISPTHVIVDCLDNYRTRFLLNRYCVAHGIPLVHGGIEGFYGQISTVLPGITPCLECMYAGLEDPKDENGHLRPKPVIGAAVGVIGSLQALEVIKLITGLGELITNRLLIFDGMEGRFDEIAIERDKTCSICGTYEENSV